MADNSQQQPRRRGPGRPFKPGVCPNPGGRPKEAAEVKALAREHGAAAVRKLAELMDSADPKTQVAAARELLDRGYGRPSQSVEISGNPDRPLHVKAEEIPDDLLAKIALGNAITQSMCSTCGALYTGAHKCEEKT